MISVTSIVSDWSRSTKIFIGLVVFYMALTFIIPASNIATANYNLTDAQYYYLLFIVRLPIVAVWCTAFYSYRVLYAYVDRIKDTGEGASFEAIKRGVAWIAWGLPVPAIVAAIIGGFANTYPDARIISLVITNYMYVVAALVAFSFIGGGVYRLAERSKFHLSAKHIRWLILGMVTLGVLFCYLIMLKLNGSSLGDSLNSYYLPNGLVWISVVVPYLYAWFVGLFAAVQLLMVAQRTSGVIYRRALQYLAIGLVGIIVSMCLLQYYRSVIPRTGVLSIGGTLIGTYFIYALHAAGSIVMALGAKRLKKIEEV